MLGRKTRPKPDNRSLKSGQERWFATHQIVFFIQDFVPEKLLSAQAASRRLGVRVTCLYDWLGQSDHGQFMLRGQHVTIDYLQGGPHGQGRIQISEREIERLQELMRVRPHNDVPRRPPVRSPQYPGITVLLGRPE